MANARGVDRGFFPLDKELKLLPGSLTPYGHEILVRLSAWMPFKKAVELLADLVGIRVSQSQGRRYAEGAGAAYVEIQNQAVEQIEKGLPAVQQGANAKMQISADGAMVPLLHGQWGEVRTLVVGEVQPAVKEKEEWVVHTRELSYFSRKVSAQEFERLSLVEMHRRGVENAKQVAAIMDGAEWEQGFIDYHCPNATRILDFPHAGEHISPIGEYLHGQNTPEGKQWLGEKLHQLKQDGPIGLLTEIRQLQEQHPDVEAISANLAYLEKREAQMQYPIFQAQGWPIGSGIVESGNKLVVEARLKGSGMHWDDPNVDSMLALRNILCSDRWKEEWPKIEIQLCQHNSDQRQQLHQSRAAQKASMIPMAFPPAVPVDDRPETFMPVMLRPASPRKPKVNPWRKFKYGRALYLPKKLPKN